MAFYNGNIGRDVRLDEIRLYFDGREKKTIVGRNVQIVHRRFVMRENSQQQPRTEIVDVDVRVAAANVTTHRIVRHGQTGDLNEKVRFFFFFRRKILVLLRRNVLRACECRCR